MELAEYNLELHIDRGGVDPWGKLKKWVGREYAHSPHVKEFWANCKDDKVWMYHYIRMTVTFLKSINLFQVPD